MTVFGDKEELESSVLSAIFLGVFITLRLSFRIFKTAIIIVIASGVFKDYI